MNDMEMDAKIPVDVIYIKEEPDPVENWPHVKEKSVEDSAQADAVSENKLSSLLASPLKHDSSDASIPKNPSKTSLFKETNFEVHKDVTRIGEEIEYNASCDTACGYQLASRLQSTDQVFVEDLPDSEGEKSSTCEETNVGTHKGVTKIEEDITHIASCDTSQLRPTEQVFVDDRPDKEGEGTSACEENNIGIHKDVTKIGEDNTFNASFETSCDAAPQLQPTEQVFVEDLPDCNGERISTCEEANIGIHKDITKVDEDITYNANCDTSELRPTEQMIVEDLPDSERERTSTCEENNIGVDNDVTKIEEDITSNASCDTFELRPTEQMLVEDLPDNDGERTSSCEETNIGFQNDVTKIEEDITYNVSGDTTSRLRPTKQVFMGDLPDSEGERTSTCETSMTDFSQDEVSSSDDDIKSEEDDYSSDNWMEIKEETLGFDSHIDDVRGVESPSLSALPEGTVTSMEQKLRQTKEKPLVEHMKIRKKKKPFVCDICKKPIDKKSKLIEHMRVHTGEKPFICDVCNKAFAHKCTLVIHMRLHKGEKPFTCNICNKAFVINSELVAHMRVHTKEKPFTCNICSKAFSRKGALAKHIRVHTKEDSFVCDICNKSFCRKKNLEQHLKLHREENPFTCDVCNRSFFRQKTLENHMQIHAAENPLTCNVCSKSYCSEKYLLKHMEMHTKENSFTCDVCNKSFTRKATLMIHIRIHAEEKPFTCEICNKSYCQKGALLIHSRVHTGEKPFSCDECGKTFGRKDTLKKHMGLHTREHFTCDLCTKAFAQKSKYEEHILMHTEKSIIYL